jgi:xylulokinase/glycerol kinase
VDPYFSLPKLLWLKENNPQVFHKSHKFLAVHDLIIHYLTGEFITDWTQASRTMLFNIESLQWDSELCDRFGIPMEKLPRAVPPGTTVGGLRNSAMKDLDSARSIPVVAVGGDQQAAAIGLGIVSPGLMCANTGTGSFILAYSDKPAFDEGSRIICTASGVPGKWLMEAGIFTSGAVYRWFRDNFGILEKQTAERLGVDAYEIMNREVEKSEMGAEGVMLLPHFAGSAAPYWNPKARGIIFGLTLGHKRSSVIRALLEGLAFEIHKNIKIIENLIGEVREIRVSGGAARSTTFNQVQADVYGRPVIRGTSEQSSALGALMTALTSMGVYPDIESAAKRLIRFDVHDKKTPNEEAHGLYEKISELHHDLYEALDSQNIYERANEILELMRKT